MKKLMAITLAVMLVFSAVAVGYAAPKGFTPPGQAKKMFTDTEDHWAASVINDLAADGLLKGYGNGKFMPNKAVTKLESLVMLYEVVDEYGETSPAADDSDSDIHGLYKGPDWGIGYYEWAWDNGAFGDSTKIFNANAAITRAEFAFYAANLIANKTLDEKDFYWDDYENYLSYKYRDNVDEEYAKGVAAMSRLRFMIGNDENMFNGGGSLKRAEAATVMYRLRFIDYGEVSDPSGKIRVTYTADETFDEDWLGFTIKVDSNKDKYKGEEVKMIFDFKELPFWFKIDYDGEELEEGDDIDTYVSPEFTLEDEDETMEIDFRAYIPTPGAYVIPVEFMSTVSPTASLFEFDMDMGRVALDDDSIDDAEAGNEVIYGLSTGTAYRVTEIGSGDVSYTTSDGTLDEDIKKMQPLDDVGIITGLNNKNEYLVEIPLSLEIHDVTTSSATTLNAFEFELTSTPNDDSGVTVSAFYLFDDDMTLEYKNASDEWIEIEDDVLVETLELATEVKSELRIDVDDATDKILMVEFRLEGEDTVLGQASYNFEE